MIFAHRCVRPRPPCIFRQCHDLGHYAILRCNPNSGDRVILLNETVEAEDAIREGEEQMNKETRGMRTGPQYHLPKLLWPKGVRMVPTRNWNSWTVMKVSKTRKKLTC